MKTYKFKLYRSRRNNHIHRLIETAGKVYNHCIDLHDRYYSLYHKSLSYRKLQNFLTKIKRFPKYVFWNQLGSQCIKDVALRIDRARRRHFSCVKSGMKSSLPKRKNVKKYKSFTFPTPNNGYKYYDEINTISLQVIKKRNSSSTSLAI